MLLCDFFNILSGPLLVGHGDMTVHYGFSEECGRKQLFFSLRAWWCLLKSLAISRLGTSVCRGTVIFFSCLVFHSVSHVPLLQILFRVRACSHVLLHVLSFELLGLCKRLASCVKRRTIFLSDGNFLKPLCFYFCREWSQFYQVNDVLSELS